MKKSILILAGLALPALAIAEPTVVPKLVSNVYALQMSPNGKWVGSMAGNASVYNMETGAIVSYPSSFLGLGNCVADNGWAVGSSTNDAMMLINGVEVSPEAMKPFWFSDINAITPDATRVTGLVNDTVKGSQIFYVPFVADLTSDGTVVNMKILKHPEYDLLGTPPQYSTGVWISDDGKTAMGIVVDYMGRYTYPIVYKEDAQGEWDYFLPAEALFNPDNIIVPENPWLNEPPFPEAQDYMSGIFKDLYLQALEKYSNGSGPFPNPDDYFQNSQEKNAYYAAVEEYDKWYYAALPDIKAFDDAYTQVLNTSINFSANEMALHPSGDYFMIRGGISTGIETETSEIYKFNSDNSQYVSYSTPSNEYFPCQILPDGTLIITKGIMDVPSSYLMLPGSDEFITVQDYFRANYPEVSEWLDNTVPGGTGVLLSNYDKTVFTGALIPDQLAFGNSENDPYYHTYIIDLNASGIESIVDETEDGLYKVYNLQGVKVMESKDASVINNLPKGIYVVNGKKVAV